MELLIIPSVLAIGAFYLNRSERAVERQIAEDRAKLEREIAIDRQQEAALQAYLDRMADLLLKENLRTSDNKEVRNVARIRTLTVLRGLDPRRKGLVLQFLQEAKLISNEETLVSLADSDLSRANLAGSNLEGANLRFAFIEGANLEYANLNDASLEGAKLNHANLRHAFVERANMRGAKLEGAKLQLAILAGAIMPDGTKHD